MNNPYEPKAEEIKVGKEEVKPEPVSPVIENDDSEKLYLANSLGIKNLDEIRKNDLQIQRLVDWAKAKGATTREDIAWSIRQLAARVGTPAIGDGNIKHLSVYAYLELERLKIDKQLKEMTANG